MLIIRLLDLTEDDINNECEPDSKFIKLIQVKIKFLILKIIKLII